MYNLIQPKTNDVVQIYSDLWYFFDGKQWVEMTLQQQLEYSK